MATARSRKAGRGEPAGDASLRDALGAGAFAALGAFTLAGLAFAGLALGAGLGRAGLGMLGFAFAGRDTLGAGAGEAVLLAMPPEGAAAREADDERGDF